MQLNRAKELLYQDLDIVNLLEMIKDYRLIKRVFFTHDDRQLLQLQHRDTVRASTTESDNQDELNGKSVN